MPPAHDSERLFNARVLLEFAAKEVTEARPVDADELSIVICATVDVLHALYQASRTLGVEPPELVELEGWVGRLRLL